MTVCGGWSLEKYDRNGYHAITMWCRSWSCADCAPRRKRQLQSMARSGKPNKFLTLTIRAGMAGTPEEHAQMLSDAFKLLIKRWRRYKPNSEIEYLAIFEPHLSGIPHLHVCLRAPYTDQKWLSAQMSELIDSPHVDIRAVTDQGRVAFYISKYITKANKRFGSMKRYWCSKKYQPPREGNSDADEPRLGAWRLVKESLSSLAEFCRTMQREVVWLSDTEIMAPPGAEWRWRPAWERGPQ